MERTQEQQIAEEEAWHQLPLEERKATLPRQLAGMQLQLELPKRLIERDEVVAAASEGNPHTWPRLTAAALLLCWPSAQKRSGVPRYRGDVIDYGGQVYDFLLGHGASQLEILRAGGVAVFMCTQAAMAQHSAREDVQGNGAAGGGSAPANSSPSSAGLASSPVASAALTRTSQGS